MDRKIASKVAEIRGASTQAPVVKDKPAPAVEKVPEAPPKTQELPDLRTKLKQMTLKNSVPMTDAEWTQIVKSNLQKYETD